MADVQTFRMLIDGARADASDRQTFNSINPATGQVWSTIPEAIGDDVDNAVRAADRAFGEGPWARDGDQTGPLPAAPSRPAGRGVVELIRPDPPIRHPTLVMTAENDSGSTPAMTRAIAAEIPGAETVIVPHRQHMALAEEPARFTGPLLRFLDQELGGP